MARAGWSPVMAALLLAGCSTVSLKEGHDLAANGTFAAAALHDNAAVAADDYRSNAQRSALLEMLVAASNPVVPQHEPGPDAAGYAQIAAALDARTRMLGKLIDLYRSFGANVNADARGATVAAFGALVTSVDGYRNAVAAIPGAQLADSPVTGAIGQVLGLFAQEVQKRNAAKASVLVRAQLDRVHQALAAEQQVAISVQKTNLLMKETLRGALMRQGLADPEPALASLTALADAPLNPAAAAVYAKQERLRTAVDLYLRWDTQQRLRAVEQSYVESLDVLGDLVAGHEQFEAGHPFDLAQLVASVDELASLTTQLSHGKAAP